MVGFKQVLERIGAYAFGPYLDMKSVLELRTANGECCDGRMECFLMSLLRSLRERVNQQAASYQRRADRLRHRAELLDDLMETMT